MPRANLAAVLVCVSTLTAQQPTPEIVQARQELMRVQELVASGALPLVRLEQAKEVIADAEDAAVLRQTLYGGPGLEDLTGPQNETLLDSMLSAAKRRLERCQKRQAQAKELVDIGASAQSSLIPFQEDVDDRRKTLELAENRVRVYRHLAEIARAEAAAVQSSSEEHSSSPSGAEQFQGGSSLSPRKLQDIETAFENQFGHSLPVSANGETALHRSLGFDHRGRVDIAVNPDEPEGKWLRKLLESARIPYLAFRHFVPGQATAAHIHIGPPSSKLRAGD